MICILEDDDNIREIENFALKNCGFVTEPAASAKEFWEIMEHKIPQLILLDIMLPDEDGISILTKLKKNPEWKKVPVILVTAKTSEMDKVKGLDTGADDYISKPFGVLELITNGSIELNVEKHVVSYDGNNIELTYKEFELLRVLMKNAGNVMTREILMDRVWGTSYEGESRTLDMHIKTLRKKLGEDGGKLIKTVRNVGYKFQS